MTVNSYPEGSVVIVRFCFTSRALTATELAAFLAGNGLPAGVGMDPNTVYFVYSPGWGGAVTTLTGGSITKDATGAYHVNLLATTPGNWPYYAYGLDVSSNPVAATANTFFGVVQNLP